MSPPQLPGCFSALFQRSSKTHRKSNKDAPATKGPVPKYEDINKSDLTLPCRQMNLCCDFSYAPPEKWWVSEGEEKPPAYSPPESSKDIYRPDVLRTIEHKLDALNSDLRDLSLQIHGHPELGFEEKFAHDLLTNFMSNNGFTVTRHYLGLDTAWRAEFQHSEGGRALGVNSEMDALPGMGHACGHNLIAMSGVGVAIAVKAALEAHDIPGKVILLGTPAEEGGGGKIILLDRGGYDDMDACVMCHPSPGPQQSVSTGSTNAMRPINVEYFGRAAHAGASPWDGTNALDAAFLAYSGISVLRQQIKPDHRVHGIIRPGKDWAVNVIPDYASMQWIIRTATYPELEVFQERVVACLQAAAMATGCEYKITYGLPYYDLHQNTAMGEAFSKIVGYRYGLTTSTTASTASTDFGNVTYRLPSLHPNFAIPTSPGGGNHTPAFAQSARTKAAHDAAIVITKGLAHTGFRLLSDDAFFNQVQCAHKMANDI
ncbi:peptidase M20A family protein [Pleurotus pulmonarius]